MFRGSGLAYVATGTVSYAMYREGQSFLAGKFDHTVTSRWGVALQLGSTIVTVVATSSGLLIFLLVKLLKKLFRSTSLKKYFLLHRWDSNKQRAENSCQITALVEHSYQVAQN